MILDQVAIVQLMKSQAVGITPSSSDYAIWSLEKKPKNELTEQLTKFCKINDYVAELKKKENKNIS
jgi:hypothetical protein